MQIQEIGEFRLIDRIIGRLGVGSADIVVGPGDDAAAMRPSSNALLVATCDAQVEGRHFSRKYISAEQLGRRLAAVNLSDIAAMGARPRWALASFALPEQTEAGFVEACVAGLADELQRFGAHVVGGNLTGSEQLVLDLTLLGEAWPGSLIRRSGAVPGDVILVTGDLGGAAAGRAALEHPLQTPEAEACIARHLVPTPRMAAGRTVAESGLAHAMIDISDGLAQDLGHLCDASATDVVLEIDALPINDHTRGVAAALEEDAVQLALSGGEDYELLCAASPADAERLIDAVFQAAAIPLTRIGTILPQGQGRWLQRSGGIRTPLQRQGWQHFGRKATAPNSYGAG